MEEEPSPSEVNSGYWWVLMQRLCMGIQTKYFLSKPFKSLANSLPFSRRNASE